MARRIQGLLLPLTLAASATLTSPAAVALDDTILVRVRGISVTPQSESGPVSVNGAAVAGSEVNVDTDMVPELDITWKFLPHWGAELILGTSAHTVSGAGTLVGLRDVIDSWVLPPTLTLQYHFNPEGTFRPYVGIGVNYTIFYNEEVAGVLNQPGASVDIDNSWGVALQAGADFAITDRWFLNADIKYIDIDTTANFTNTTVGNASVNVDIDPVVFGLGVGYRF